MLEERIVDLVHRDLDGEIDPDEQVELRLRLDRDHDAKLYYDAMLDLSDTLRARPVDEPPAGFTAAVMSDIRAKGPRRAVAAVARPLFGRRHDRFLAVRVGIGLAAAIAIAVVLAPSLFRALDPGHLGGTMMPPRAGESRTLEAGGDTRIAVSTSGRQLSLRFIAGEGSPREADLNFDPASLRLIRTEGVISSRSERGEIHISFEGRSALLQFERTTKERLSLSVNVRDGTESAKTSIEVPATTNF